MTLWALPDLLPFACPNPTAVLLVEEVLCLPLLSCRDNSLWQGCPSATLTPFFLMDPEVVLSPAQLPLLSATLPDTPSLGSETQFQYVYVCTSVCVFAGLLPPHRQATLRQQPGILQFSSILTVSTWRQHQPLQVKGSVPQACPALQTLSPVLLTDQLQIGVYNKPSISDHLSVNQSFH